MHIIFVHVHIYCITFMLHIGGLKSVTAAVNIPFLHIPHIQPNDTHLLLLPLALQSVVGFGLSNNVFPFFPICH
jgi:hypothetical protein